MRNRHDDESIRGVSVFTINKRYSKAKTEVTFKKKKKTTYMEFYSELLGRRVEKSFLFIGGKDWRAERREKSIDSVPLALSISRLKVEI